MDMDVVRALDAEIEQARRTLKQKIFSSPVSIVPREKIVQDVLRGTEWAIRLQLARQSGDLSYEQFRTLLGTYLEKLVVLKQEAWAMIGRDFAVLRFVLDEQVRVAGQAARFMQECRGAVPSWLAHALALNIATLISEAEAAGALREHIEGVHLKTVYDEQIARALGGVATIETQQ
ncbi:hypothetical protein HYW67_02370 [Candidatus Parcubacteria bacterium]|nr:hypothetical protein [Candidatus Parcubacteria bacterium]